MSSASINAQGAVDDAQTKTRAWPLGVHIAALVLSIAVPALVVAGIALWRLNAAERTETEQRLIATTRVLTLDLDREVAEITTTLEVLATAPSLRVQDLSAFENQAREVGRGRAWYLFLANEQGRMLLNTLAPPGAALPPFPVPELFRSVVEAKRAHVSNLFESPVSGRKVLAVLVPVLRNGESPYVLGLGFEPSYLLPVLARTAIDPGWVAMIQDRRGVVLVRSQDQEVWSGRPAPLPEFEPLMQRTTGLAELRSAAGYDLTSWARSRLSDWVGAIAVPDQVRSARTTQAWLGFAAFSAALMVFAGLLATIFVRAIARPMHALARVAASTDDRRFQPSHLREANEIGTALAKAARRVSVSEVRFRTLAERARDIVLLLDERGTILEANAAAAQTYGYTIEELTGQPVTLLREPEQVAEVQAQLARAASTGILFETLHRRKDGVLIPVEVSATPARIGDEKLIFSIIRDISRRKRGEAALRERESLLQTVTQNVGIGLVLLDMERRCTFANPAYSEWLRRSPEDILGKTIDDILGAIYGDMREPLDRAYSGHLVSFEFKEEPDEAGEHGGRVWQVTCQPARDAGGRMSGLIVVMIDITGPKRDADHIRFLMRELSHRSKNLLAVIQAMARQTSRSSEGLADFEERFSARVMGLARSHDLLVQQDWQGVALADLVRIQIQPFVDAFDERVILDGPLLTLNPEAANHLGLALHELATNAFKYGALRTAEGKVHVSWEVDHAAQIFRMTWRESDGPQVRAPGRSGFGTQVVQNIVATALNGVAHIGFDRSGVEWRLEAPLASIALPPRSRRALSAAVTPPGPSRDAAPPPP